MGLCRMVLEADLVVRAVDAVDLPAASAPVARADADLVRVSGPETAAAVAAWKACGSNFTSTGVSTGVVSLVTRRGMPSFPLGRSFSMSALRASSAATASRTDEELAAIYLVQKWAARRLAVTCARLSYVLYCTNSYCSCAFLLDS